MKIETYLNAMEIANLRRRYDTKDLSKSIRQYNAFRNRILKIDAKKEKLIQDLYQICLKRDKTIVELEGNNE